MNQVVTIKKDGTISGLQRKRGQGIDLRQFGHAQIERASEIKWNEGQQRWMIEIKNTAVRAWMSDECVEILDFQDAVGSDPQMPYEVMGLGRLMFQDYDDAVKAEIVFLDAMRSRGVF